EDRVADVAVHPRHGAGLDAAFEAVAHDQLIALPEAVDKRIELAEIIGIVGVAHDDIATLGGGDAGLQGAAVTPAFHRHHACPMFEGDFAGTVAAAVIRHHHFAFHMKAIQTSASLVHAGADGAGFVQARHDHGDF